MIATRRSIKMHKKRLVKEYFKLAKRSIKWGKNFSVGNSYTSKVGSGGSRKRKEARLEKKLKKFRFKE